MIFLSYGGFKARNFLIESGNFFWVHFLYEYIYIYIKGCNMIGLFGNWRSLQRPFWHSFGDRRRWFWSKRWFWSSAFPTTPFWHSFDSFIRRDQLPSIFYFSLVKMSVVNLMTSIFRFHWSNGWYDNVKQTVNKISEKTYCWCFDAC